MFGLFSKKKNICPIDPEMRLWIENNVIWLATQFGEENIKSKPILFPTPDHFPIHYDGSKESLSKTAAIVAQQMDININEISLHVFEQNIQAFESDMGNRIYTEVDKDSEHRLASGLYFAKDDDGKYDIFIERMNLSDPQNLVATLAHEFSHIKLLGEKNLDINDEHLTDLATVIFGLGIFNANSAFKEWKSYEGYGHNTIGYVSQREWGYALALYAHFREEENPVWIKYLTPNLRSDFKKSMDFIQANKDSIFKEEYKGSSISDLSRKAAELHNDQKIEDAIVAYNEILERDPQNAFAKINLKQLEIYKLSERAHELHIENKFEEARQIYNQILKIDEDDEWAKENLELLPK